MQKALHGSDFKRHMNMGLTWGYVKKINSLSSLSDSAGKVVLYTVQVCLPEIVAKFDLCKAYKESPIFTNSLRCHSGLLQNPCESTGASDPVCFAPSERGTPLEKCAQRSMLPFPIAETLGIMKQC